MIFLFKTIVGLLLFESIVSYDGADLVAEPSQQQNSFSSSVNSIVLQPGQPFALASGSFSGNDNGKPFGGSFVNNNGQVVSQMFTPGSQLNNRNGGDSEIYNTGNIRSDVSDTNTPYWWVGDNSPFKDVSIGGDSINCVSDECYDSKGRLMAKVFDNTNNNNNNNNRNYNGNNNDNFKSDYSQNMFLNGNYAAATSNNQNAVRQSSFVQNSNQNQNYGSNTFDNGQGSNSKTQYPSDSSVFASNQVLSVGSVGGQQSYYSGKRNANGYDQATGNSQISSQSSPAGLGSGFVKASSFVDEPKQYLPPVPTPVPCSGRGQACVPNQQCQNGYISQLQFAAIGSTNQNCNPNFEVCCTVQEARAPQTQRPVVPSTYRPVTQPQTYRPTQAPQTYRPTQAPQTYRPTQPPQTYRPNTQAPTYRPQVSQTAYLPPLVQQEPTSRPQPPPTYRPAPPQTQRPTPRPTQRPTPPPSTPCQQNGYVCVSPNLCRNGVITASAVPQSSSSGQCYTGTVCCRIQAENNNQYLPPIDGDSSNQNPAYLATARPAVKPDRENDYETGPSNDQNTILRPTTRRPVQPPRVFDAEQSSNIVQAFPVGCPAALNCTEIQFCTDKGVISKTPVVLTPQQEEFRVPMTDCRDLEKGITGKCCRDPDYTDPWPVGQLGQYNEEAFGFKPERNNNNNPRRPQTGENELSRPRPASQGPKATATTNQFISRVPSPLNQAASSLSTQTFISQSTRPASSRNPFPQTFAEVSNDLPEFTPSFTPVRPTSNVLTTLNGGFDQVPGSSGVCGVRNYDNAPRGAGPFDTAFGEFPWQAMVLLESNKSLLCGGAITDKNMVVTAAHCVEGLRPYDVLIKAGEWRLGSDEEPRPFQLIRVKKIMSHPAYQPTSLNHDVALLELESDLTYDNHIGPICIDNPDLEPSASSNCVTTGWGKNVLKVHISNSLMRQSPVTIIPQQECQAKLSGYGFNPDSSRCGRTQADACELDVGSALACADGSGQYSLKGVYSTETECASPSQIVTFTKMDLSWVKKTSSQPGYTIQPKQQQTPNKLYETQATQTVLTTGPQYLPPV